jgi:hypothetical protein
VIITTDSKPIKTKQSHPYSYDPIVLYEGNPAPENTEPGTIYTDRLLQWDYDKHNALCTKHFGNEGQWWDQREPADIEAFLRDWCNDADLILVKVVEYCNVSTGFPTWQLNYAKAVLPS